MKSKFQSTIPGATSPRATYQDILDTPPHLTAEIVDGVLYTHPRPFPPHGDATFGLSSVLGPPFRFGRGGPGGWLIHGEPELHLGGIIVVPDLAGWRRERLPMMPKKSHITIVPDWVCEVLPDSTRTFDLDTKREVYARAGVTDLWYIDSDVQSLEAYELVHSQWTLIDKRFDNATVSLPPFDAISFNLGDLWLPNYRQAAHKESQSRSTPESRVC